MAQKVTVILTDDIDGSEATRTVQFALHGKNYEIDLSESHAEELDAALEKFIKAGRTLTSGNTGRSRKSTSAKSSGPDAAKVRAWAAMNGIEVNPRGRIPKEIIERYEAANGKPVEAPKTADKPAQEAEKPAQAAEKPKEQAKPAAAPKSPEKGTRGTKNTAEKVAKEEEKGTQKTASK